MDCDTCREALSARIDREAEPVSPDEHFRSCVACQEWYADAVALRGAVRLEEPAPDLADAVLGQVEPRAGLLGGTRWRYRRST